MSKLKEAVEQLQNHQKQLDMDGVTVGVSREALDIVLKHVERVASVCVIMANDGIETVVCPDLSDATVARVKKKYHDEWVRGGDTRFGEPYAGSGQRFVRAEEFDVEL